MLIAVLSIAPQYCSLSWVFQVSVLPSLFLINLSNLVICSSVLLAGSTFSWSLINRLSKAVSLSKFSENTFISISEPCLNTPQDFCLHEFSSTEWLRINQKLPRLRGVFKTILLSYLLKYFSNKYIFNKQLAHVSADIISVCHRLSKENVIWYSFCSWLSLMTAMSSCFLYPVLKRALSQTLDQETGPWKHKLLTSALVTTKTAGDAEKIFIKSLRVRDEISSFISKVGSLVTAVQMCSHKC